MSTSRNATVIVAALCALGLARGSASAALSFFDNFADGIGHPGFYPATSDWDNGDVVDGQTWSIPNENDSFGSPFVAAKRDTGSIGGTGNNRAGRLRVLATSTVDMLAAIDLTSTITDNSTLRILDIGDGIGDSGGSVGTTFRVRLLDSLSTVALELVLDPVPGIGGLLELRVSQANAGTFVDNPDDINWRSGVGANLEIGFDVLTDTFTALVTETSGGGMVSLGSTAFDNAVTEIARIELVVDQANVGIGAEASFESIRLGVVPVVPEPGSLALIGIGALLASQHRKRRSRQTEVPPLPQT